jgi:hypothetical protein
MDVQLIYKLNQDNLVLATLSWKEYNEKPSTNTQYPWAIFVGESHLERKIREVYVVDPLAQHYFTEL